MNEADEIRYKNYNITRLFFTAYYYSDHFSKLKMSKEMKATTQIIELSKELGDKAQLAIYSITRDYLDELADRIFQNVKNPNLSLLFKNTNSEQKDARLKNWIIHELSRICKNNKGAIWPEIIDSLKGDSFKPVRKGFEIEKIIHSKDNEFIKKALIQRRSRWRNLCKKNNVSPDFFNLEVPNDSKFIRLTKSSII